MTQPGDDATGQLERHCLRENGDDPEIGGGRSGRVALHSPQRSARTQRGDDLSLIEATVVDELPVDVHACAEGHPECPDINTGDQFFDNRDVESYRMLGVALTARALSTENGKAFGAHVSELPDPATVECLRTLRCPRPDVDLEHSLATTSVGLEDVYLGTGSWSDLRKPLAFHRCPPAHTNDGSAVESGVFATSKAQSNRRLLSKLAVAITFLVAPSASVVATASLGDLQVLRRLLTWRPLTSGDDLDARTERAHRAATKPLRAGLF